MTGRPDCIDLEWCDAEVFFAGEDQGFAVAGVVVDHVESG